MYAIYSKDGQSGFEPLITIARAVCPPNAVVEIWKDYGVIVRVGVNGLWYTCQGAEAAIPDDTSHFAFRSPTSGPEAAFLAWSVLSGDEKAKQITMIVDNDIVSAMLTTEVIPYDLRSLTKFKLLEGVVRKAGSVLRRPRHAILIISEDNEHIGWFLIMRVNQMYAIVVQMTNGNVQFFEEGGDVRTQITPEDAQLLFGEIHSNPSASLEDVVMYTTDLVSRFAKKFPLRWVENW